MSNKSKKSVTRVITGLVIIVLIALARSQGWLPSSTEAESPASTPAAAPAQSPASPSSPSRNGGETNTRSTGGAIAKAFRSQRSGVMVEESGVVDRILPDDNEGSRHQRFVLRLVDGSTVLVAHNIDLAPRVPLELGDTIDFKGQYEWNERGGVVHWTHHDPAGSHPGGWLSHAGRKYE